MKAEEGGNISMIGLAAESEWNIRWSGIKYDFEKLLATHFFPVMVMNAVFVLGDLE